MRATDEEKNTETLVNNKKGENVRFSPFLKNIRSRLEYST